MTIDLECYRGDTAEWTIAATRDGDPIDLTGATVTMTARRNSVSPIIFQRTSAPGEGITIDDDPETGIVVAKLRSLDTLGISNQLTELVYDVRVETASGDNWLVATGTLTVKPDVTL